MSALYENRHAAGMRLAECLTDYAGRDDVILLALPRGGVPVAFAIADTLGMPLDLFMVRPFTAPDNSDINVGVVATGGFRVVDPTVLYELSISELQIDRIVAYELPQLEQAEYLYRRDRPYPDLAGRTAILVDDGLTDPGTLRAAVHALRQHGVGGVVLASPGIFPDAAAGLRHDVDALVLGATPDEDTDVSVSYADDTPVTDNEVRSLLEQAAAYEQSSLDDL